MGLQLGVSEYELGTIEKNYPQEMCKVEMFRAWLKGHTNPTYEKLVRALAAIGKRNIAEFFCTAQGDKYWNY